MSSNSTYNAKKYIIFLKFLNIKTKKFPSTLWPVSLLGLHFSKPSTIYLTYIKLIIQLNLVILGINGVDNLKLCYAPVALQILAEFIISQSRKLHTETHRLRGNGANVSII